MKIHKADSNIEMAEHLIEKDRQTVTHLCLKEGKELSTHSVDMSVIVVPFKGTIEFTGESGMETIKPGTIVEMEPNEKHSLKAVEDSQLIVVKSKIK